MRSTPEMEGLLTVKRLIEVTRETGTSVPHSMFLRYEAEPPERTISLDGDDHYVNVDLTNSGDVVGIEIAFPDDESIDLVVKYAHENGLSLAGVFDPGSIAS